LKIWEAAGMTKPRQMQLKKAICEMGGKNAIIVDTDADLDEAVPAILASAFSYQGQKCSAASRLIVLEPVYERLKGRLADAASSMRMGAPEDPASGMGPVIDKAAYDRIRGFIEAAKGYASLVYSGEVPAGDGYTIGPTIFGEVPADSALAQQEIFGPVLAAMTFRTPKEAVELANNTVYGLAASVWSESINVALQTAAQIKAGVVWVNSTNLFDAACGFGGYRESGYGREGGKEGLREYLEPVWFRKAPPLRREAGKRGEAAEVANPSVDRTVKLHIGGKQARPDSGYSVEIRAKNGKLLGESPLGNRKDIRNAVEAARKAESWAKTTAHNRAQVLYYIAENLSQRAAEIATRLAGAVGKKQAALEVKLSVERLFSYAGWTDKFEGAVHNPPFRNISIAMNEPVGTVGVLCPAEAPLLGFFSLVLPLIAAGNTVVAVPSGTYPLIAGDLYQVFETSDLPGGVVNLVTGRAGELLKVLVEHDDVDALWCYGDADACAAAKALSIGNLKQVWTNEGREIDFFNPSQGEGPWYLEHAYQVKNIWVPYGE
jgi:aldehyde dehydrogenase (NAD+)